MAEGAALRILAGDADRRALGQQRRERERLGEPPIGLAVGAERGLAAIELPCEFRVGREALRKRDDLVVPARELAGGDARLDERVLGRRRRGTLRTGVFGALAAFDGVVGLGDALAGSGDHRGRIVGLDDAVRDQVLRVQLPDGRVALDALVHLRLRVRRLVGLVVTEAAIADDVDDRVAPKAAAEVDGETDGGDARLHVVGVDVDDRHVEALGQVARVTRRARVGRVGREADLVVGDQVNRAAGGVAR